MRLRVLSSLLLLFFPACQLAAQATSNAQKFSPPTRTFRFTYNFTVKDIPSGAKRVRVWAPVPQTDQHQTARVLSVKAPVKTRMTQEPEYGNRMMYAEIQNSAPGKAEFTLQYEVTRRKYSRGNYAQLERTDQKPTVVFASMHRLIAPDSLIPTDGKIKALAVEEPDPRAARSQKPRLPMTTSLRICATTRRAQAGDAGTRCGPVTPNAATVQTSIRRSSACCGLTGFRPASTSAFHCPKTRTKEISPVITAGLNSMRAKPAGSPLTSQRRGKRSRKKIISSAALTPIGCSYPPAATSHSLLSRMVQRSITSSTRMSRSTVSRTISSTSS